MYFYIVAYKNKISIIILVKVMHCTLKNKLASINITYCHTRVARRVHTFVSRQGLLPQHAQRRRASNQQGGDQVSDEAQASHR